MSARVSFAVALVLAGTTAASAQPPDFGRKKPTGSGIGLDSLVVAVEAQPIWKGFLLGPVGATGRADFKLAGRAVTAAGPWGLTGHAFGTVADARRRSVSDGHFGAGLDLFRATGRNEEAFRFGTEVYRVPGADTDKNGIELAVGITEFEWRWGLEEVNPRFALTVARDFGRFDGFRADLDGRVALGIQNVAFGGFRDVEGWLEAHGSWSDYDDAGSADDGFARFGLGGALDRGLWELSLRIGVQDPRDAGWRGWLALAVRIWPDGRPIG